MNASDATGDALRRQVLRFDPALPLEDASTPPASWYLDPALAELERRAVFDRAWIPVARTAQLERPGSFVAGEHAGEPWVVARASDGRLRAHRNVCRHKATPVARGEGSCDAFTCPYHGWRYALDGSLLSAPEVGGIRGFEREAQGLRPLRVDTWGPFVFVCGAADAPPLAEHVAALDAPFAATRWESLTWAARREYEVACNWKVFCDNYLDGGYHVAHMHPTLDAQLDMASYRTVLHATTSLQTSGGTTAAQDRRLDYEPGARIGGGALYAFAYPNLMLNRYGPVLDSNLVLPLGPDRCRVVFEFFFEDVAGREAEAFVTRSIAQSEQTQLEDMAVSELVQAGMRSSAWDGGRYAPRREQAVLHFHRLLARDLRAALALPAGG